MSVFTIYNPTTKHIAEETEFAYFQLADKYCKENYGEGYVTKHKPFQFGSNFRKMLNSGTHPRVKTDNRGHSVAIISEDNDCVFHCGGITLNEWEYMRAIGIKAKMISKVEFINLHNSLIG